MPRLTGKNGTVQIVAGEGAAATKTEVFNWEANFSGVMLDCSIKGDLQSRFVFDHGTGTFTAERYVQTKATLANLISTFDTGARVTFALYLVNTDTTYSAITGKGYITRADLAAPHAKAVDRIEVQMDEFTLTAF